MEKRAQIAFTDGVTWAVVYEYASCHGRWDAFPMPRVDCVIVDTTDVFSADGIIQRARSSPKGFEDVERLIEKLAAKGCEIRRPPHDPDYLTRIGCASFISSQV
jgi:hypothetical protein